MRHTILKALSLLCTFYVLSILIPDIFIAPNIGGAVVMILMAATAVSLLTY